MKRKKTINEIASDRCAQLWREHWARNPEEFEKLKRDAKQAEEFLERLAESTRTST
jgi:hypothetical protein